MQLYQIQFKFILKSKDHAILIFVKYMISIWILIIIFLSLKKWMMVILYKYAFSNSTHWVSENKLVVSASTLSH